MRRTRLFSIAALGLAVGCSGKSAPQIVGGDNAPAFAVAPEIPDVGAMDGDRDLLDDEYFAFVHEPREVVNVEAIFSGPIDAAREVDAFTRAGGSVRHVFKAVSYGFVGTIEHGRLHAAAKALGNSSSGSSDSTSNLLLLKADRFVVPHLDEATRSGRVRPVWVNGFAGAAAGFNGSPTINIAIVDTGVDSSHPDLSGRLVLFKDYTSELIVNARDVSGHGTHVTGIAVGSGASFGIGPGTLRWTDQNDLSSLPNAGDTFRSPVHLPLSGFTLTSTAAWLGGGSTDLFISKNGDGLGTSYSTAAGPMTGTSPLTLTWSGPNQPSTRITASLTQNAAKSVGLYTITNSVTNYPAAGDGFPALRGVAPLSNYVLAKIFPTVGIALTSDIAVALDDIVTLRATHNIKVANLSFGATGNGIDTTQRSKANTMVANGIVVVTSNGNNGSSGATADPGRGANLITVGASNDVNQLTQYTSGGINGTAADEDDKPDILAPGGSFFRSRILSVDSNTADANSMLVPDAQADDYTSNSGTSMASPFVAGAAILVIQALEQAGSTWSFASTSSPFLVKNLLLASATETNTFREAGTGSPKLGRSTTPKDSFEGYGLLNPDAAIEAVKLDYDFAPFTASTANNVGDQRAWGRHVTIPAGKTLRIRLTVAPSTDFDVYLYAQTPGVAGNPTMLAASDRQAAASESLTYTAPQATTAYLFVKHVMGAGAFTLIGNLYTCGDGALEAGEDCDDHNTASNDCCSSTCTQESDFTSCTGGTCVGGVCKLTSPTDGGTDGSTPPSGGDASAPDAGGRDASSREGGSGSIDGTGPELVPIDDTEGEVAGGGCACRTSHQKNENASSIMLAAFALLAAVFMRSRRR